jgi:hypothetical protein
LIIQLLLRISLFFTHIDLIIIMPFLAFEVSCWLESKLCL